VGIAGDAARVLTVRQRRDVSGWMGMAHVVAVVATGRVEATGGWEWEELSSLRGGAGVRGGEGRGDERRARACSVLRGIEPGLLRCSRADGLRVDLPDGRCHRAGAGGGDAC